ncbi:hypothetical protein, partial [Sansalvadorimonas verongulae]
RHASFSPDGTHLVTASYDHIVKIWILKSKESNDVYTSPGPVRVSHLRP